MAAKHGIEENKDADEVAVKRSRADIDDVAAVLGVGSAKVGIWDVPDVTEQDPAIFDMDVNGNDDEVEAEVMRMKREKSAALKREAEAKRAAVDDEAAARQVQRSASPPARRARRNVGGGAASMKELLGQDDKHRTSTEATASVVIDVKELQEELQAARESVKSAKEQNALLKQLYDDASRTAMEAEQKAQRLVKENSGLQSALTQGLATASELKENRIRDLEQSLKQAEMQMTLLKRQSELTDSDVRRKAALWDDQEQVEEQRRKIVEQRQAKREAERRALQEALLGGGASTIRRSSPKPHELFLSVDLADEKVDVHEMADRQAAEETEQQYDDEDDELAALRREALQFDVQATDLDAPRSSRSRGPLAVQPPPPPIDSISSTPPVLYDAAEGQRLADALYDSQQQAYLTASNELEEQLTAFTARNDDAQPVDESPLSPSLLDRH